MELQSTMPSVVHNEQQSDLKGSSSRNSINWDKEISFEEANRALEAKFYSFKKVSNWQQKYSAKHEMFAMPRAWDKHGGSFDLEGIDRTELQ